MLTTRAGKRDKSLSGDDLLFDILDEGRPIGSVVFDKNVLEATITLAGARYTVARVNEPSEEPTYKALLRLMTGAKSRRPIPGRCRTRPAASWRWASALGSASP
jgi:hypothetical protein